MAGAAGEPYAETSAEIIDVLWSPPARTTCSVTKARCARVRESRLVYDSIGCDSGA
jgi:hypothetical protein